MMSNDEKLKNFERQALQKAEQRRDEINRELDNATGEALADCKKVFRRETARIRSKGVEEARKEARLIVSTAQNKGQSAIMSKRKEIIDEVFGALVKKLRAFTESPEGNYGELFEKRLTEALTAATVHLGESNAKITVEVTPADYKQFSKLIEEVSDRIVVWANTDVKATEEDIIGGCVVNVPSLGLVIDNSVKADVLREREDFLSWSNLSLG
ncbi:MAG: V-type ATP synthase subunit E [Clostridia bacterium]|nr:V-type ATP synthase subunit E [Clostridia bacterium]